MAVTSVFTGAGLTGGPITDSGTISLVPATEILLGGVTLVTSTSSTSTTQAATPAAVKVAYDAAVAATATANSKLSLSGGTMTGPIVFAPGQTFNALFLPIATPTSPGVVIPSTGLAVTPGGYVTTVNNGTVTSVTAGTGLGAPYSGNAVTSSGTIKLLPPSSDGTIIGGVRKGPNIRIEVDGQITTENLLQTNNPYAYNAYIWPATTTPVPAAPGENGQILTLKDKVTGELGWTSTGTLQSIVAGAGLTVSSTATTATVSLTNTTVTAATYGATGLIPTLTVNAQGQVTSGGLAFPFAPFQIATVSAPYQQVLDFADNNTNWDVSVQGATVIEAPQNASSGMRGGIILRQNTTTPYAVTWDSSWKWANHTPQPITNVAGAVDYAEFVVLDPTRILITAYLPNIG